MSNANSELLMKLLKVYLWNETDDDVNFTCVCTISLTFEICFLELPYEIVFVVISGNYLYL